MSTTTLAIAVRAARDARAWSQARLAAEAGVNDKTVRRAERGDPVAQETVLALCATLGIDIASTRLPGTTAGKPDVEVTLDPRRRAFLESVVAPGTSAGDVVSFPLGTLGECKGAPSPTPRWMSYLFRGESRLSRCLFWIGMILVAIAHTTLPGWWPAVIDTLFTLCILVGLPLLDMVLAPAYERLEHDFRRDQDDRDLVTAYVLGRDAVTIHAPGEAGTRRVSIPVDSLSSVMIADENGLVTVRLEGALGSLTLERMQRTQTLVRRLDEWRGKIGDTEPMALAL